MPMMPEEHGHADKPDDAQQTDESDENFLSPALLKPSKPFGGRGGNETLADPKIIFLVHHPGPLGGADDSEPKQNQRDHGHDRE